MHPSGEDSSELGRLVDAGAVKVILDSVYPFERSDEAMAKLESGRAKGKIVVTMPDRALRVVAVMEIRPWLA
jgi:NADPH:quinone reductase-like Zn-dependent oxidoreductase